VNRFFPYDAQSQRRLCELPGLKCDSVSGGVYRRNPRTEAAKIDVAEECGLKVFAKQKSETAT